MAGTTTGDRAGLPDDHWERPEVVERFAGCAAGRNTVFLAREGFDVHAVDASGAMVAETRRRLAPVVGEEEARRRVTVARMDALSAFDDGAFELVVSLGLLHNAGSWVEWRAAVAETARVLAENGILLVSQFTPRTDLTGEGARPVAREPHLYDGALPERRAVLLTPGELDAAMARQGLRVERPTAIGETETERGRRVSAKGLYRKGRSDAAVPTL